LRRTLTARPRGLGDETGVDGRAACPLSDETGIDGRGACPLSDEIGVDGRGGGHTLRGGDNDVSA
jgi:hypothetical protein